MDGFPPTPRKVVLDVVDVNFNVFFAGKLFGWSFFFGQSKGWIFGRWFCHTMFGEQHEIDLNMTMSNRSPDKCLQQMSW